MTIASIIDGASNTIMLMENPNGEIWTKPGDLSIDQAIELVKDLKDGEKLVVAFYDGRAMTISNQMDIETFKALLTLDGREEINPSKIK